MQPEASVVWKRDADRGSSSEVNIYYFGRDTSRSVTRHSSQRAGAWQLHEHTRRDYTSSFVASRNWSDAQGMERGRTKEGKDTFAMLHEDTHVSWGNNGYTRCVY